MEGGIVKALRKALRGRGVVVIAACSAVCAGVLAGLAAQPAVDDMQPARDQVADDMWRGDAPAAAAPAEAAAGRFTHIDIYADPRGDELGAYQVEVEALDGAHVQLVGIEGGESAAFAAAPYYDPAALMQHRVILAAFSTGKDATGDQVTLPTGRTRIARLHLRVVGEPGREEKAPQFALRVIKATNARGGWIEIGIWTAQ